jgi:hypothetical protein
MGNLVFIGNIEDQVMGGHIQVTLEEYQPSCPENGEMVLHCRVHQTLLPADHPFTLRVIAMYHEWQDHFAGSTDLDQMLSNLVAP